MPVFREGDAPPKWCELEAFKIIDTIAGEVVDQRRVASRERLLVTLGALQVRFADVSMVLREGQFIEIADGTWEIRAGARPAQFVNLSGRWGNELGGCGIFHVVNQDEPVNFGDPVEYPKTTAVDSHYHDCDEFWIVLAGAGTAVVGDRRMKVAAGDCVPIGMGYHHDLSLITEPVKAVYFETTLEGEKRVGHLWNHTHGVAEPQADRV